MTKVICNASPIIGLIGIDQFNLLWELFDEVLVPEAYCFCYIWLAYSANNGSCG